MKTGSKLFIKAFLLFCTLSAFQCNKRIGCLNNVYNFNLNIKAYPDKEVIRIGDTLWFEVNEPTSLYDHGTGRVIDYSNANNLGSVISFHQLSNENKFTVKAVKDFDFRLIEGIETRNVDPESLKEFLFIEKNNRYMFKIGVVPKKIGTYSILFSNAANVYRNDNKCSKSNFALNFKDTDQHYNLHPLYQGGNFVGGDNYFQVE